MPTITTCDATWDTGISMDAAELRRADSAIFLGDGTVNGIRGGIVYHGSSTLAVTVNGSDQVTVQRGAVAIDAGAGLGVYRGALASASSAVALTARNATNPRIDLVVAQATGTNITIKTIDGTPAASPSAPALPAQHIELARLNVPAVGGGAVTVDSTWRAFATSIGGCLLVATAARLPGSGNILGQKALALDTGTEHTWSGSVWIATPSNSQSAMASSGANVTASSVLAFRRGFLLVLNITATTTGALSSGATLFTLPAGYLPVDTIFGTIQNTTTETGIRVHANTNGTVVTQQAIGSGVLLRGSMTLPLPLT